MAITITGVGTPQQSTSARSLSSAQAATQAAGVAPSGPARTARIIQDTRLQTLPDTAATPHDGTVELVPVSTASFTWGTRAGGGYRYVSATYKVRNASQDSTAYGDARTNLTFVATNTTGTLSGTAFSVLRKFDGTPAASGLETSVVPTGWADLSSTATVTSRAADVLQVYTETEVGDLGAIAGINSVLPYGFVVNNPSTSGSRSLAANPGASQFDGLVTFAFKVPLQGLSTDDPYTITAVFLPVDDNTPVVTQSFEETDATSVANVVSRATTLGATIRSLDGIQVGSVAATHVCTVRSAGTAGSPTGFLVDSIALVSESPDPYGSTAGFIGTNPSLSATFSKTMTGPSASTFAVSSAQKGRAFFTYSGAGSTTLTAPSGTFFPGDVLEVSLTGVAGSEAGARLCTPVVYRYRTASSSATDAFTPTTITSGVGTAPYIAVLGDVNGDGKLDIVTANSGSGSVSVLLGDGNGGFAAASGSPITTGVGTTPFGIVLADVNGDGKLDIVVSNEGSGNISVLLGNGDGTFTKALKSPFSVGAGNYQLAVGDVNGDGNLDIVSASASAHTVSVLLGDGTGNFTAAPGSPISAGVAAAGFGIALADVNRDGNLDIIVPNSNSLISNTLSTVTVLLGNGTGSFTADPSGPFQAGTGPNSVVVADFNNDGKLDLVVGDEANDSVTVLQGDGAGGFTLANTIGVGGSNTLYLSVGDVDGDGKLDILAPLFQIGGSNGNKVVVAKGDGALGFTISSFTVGLNPGSVAVGDIDNDGKLDLVTGNQLGNSVTVLKNQ